MGDARWRTAPRRALMHFGPGRRLWWRARKRDEVQFWSAWLVGAPGTEQWASDREARLAPDTEIKEPLVREELERIPGEEISILDVGAGPVTSLGFRYPGKRLTIVPVDPLAGEYERLLRDAGLDPPIRTIRVAGESLLEHFGSGRFDIAYACNSLDHSADPLRVICNMVAVVRPGGVVLLRHKRNEGEQARYGGLHQWNFDVAGGSLLLWNNAARVDVGSALEGRAETTAWTSEGEAIARLVVREADSRREVPKSPREVDLGRAPVSRVQELRGRVEEHRRTSSGEPLCRLAQQALTLTCEDKRTKRHRPEPRRSVWCETMAAGVRSSLRRRRR